jgi:hypothetical protein
MCITIWIFRRIFFTSSISLSQMWGVRTRFVHRLLGVSKCTRDQSLCCIHRIEELCLVWRNFFEWSRLLTLVCNCLVLQYLWRLWPVTDEQLSMYVSSCCCCFFFFGCQSIWFFLLNGDLWVSSSISSSDMSTFDFYNCGFLPWFQFAFGFKNCMDTQQQLVELGHIILCWTMFVRLFMLFVRSLVLWRMLGLNYEYLPCSLF